MNGGGPTAQILERDGWKFEKDFVGHRKAVTCVRFNDNIFEKKQTVDGKVKSAQYVCIAIGSRDRSLSVWLTSLKRPLFVIHDVFESSILDLAWSKDGLVLMACSMDGSIAAVVLNEEELGQYFKNFWCDNCIVSGSPMTKEAKNVMLKKIYGQTIGQVSSAKPTLIENPELLRLAQNGVEEMDDVEEENSKPKPVATVKGPLDKQIEMKTSDGRRRITPIFILPNSENGPSAQNGNSMSCESVAKYQMQSSSSGSKSKIRIEKVDGVVEPNVSPGKKSDKVTAAAPAPVVLKPNMIEIKRKPGPVNSANPALKPTAPAPAPTAAASLTSSDAQGSNTNTDSSDSQPQKVKKTGGKEKKENKVKKKNRIDSESSDSSSSGSDSSSTSSDDETASQTSKSGTEAPVEKTKKPLQNGTAPAAPAPSVPPASKPVIVTQKRKAEDVPSAAQPQAKKRGRPPGSGAQTPTLVRPAAVAVVAPPPLVSAPEPTRLPAAAFRPCPGLAPLTLVNNRLNLHFSQLKVNSTHLNIFVHNDHTKTAYGNIHKVSANKTSDPLSPVLWDLMLPSPVSALLSTSSHLLLACRDATIHILSSSGSRALPPFSLPAPLHKVQVSGSLLAVVTTTARLYVWKLEPLPKVMVRNEEVSPLQRVDKRQNISLVKMSFSKEDQPILTLR